MKKITFISILVSFTVLLPLIAVADTSDQKWMTKVEVKKRGAHCINDSNCFNRYHPDIPAVANFRSCSWNRAPIDRMANFRLNNITHKAS